MSSACKTCGHSISPDVVYGTRCQCTPGAPLDMARIPMFVLYDRPTDFPDALVARLWYSLPSPIATGLALIAPPERLEDVRAALGRAGFTRIDRFPGDDTVIVESWIA